MVPIFETDILYASRESNKRHQVALNFFKKSVQGKIKPTPEISRAVNARLGLM